MLEIGREVERYTVEAELGEGGMAHVFRVRHRTLGTLHALKVLKVGGAAIRQRLVREGQVQASLRHVNIVAVTDVIEVDGAPGLLMEYVPGGSLERRLAGGRLTVVEAERIFRGVAAGVARAHAHGLIHRDLKPGNVLLGDEEDGLLPKVADFGLAKILLDGQGGVSATRSNVAMGTPAYMSPEQIRDAKGVDQRTDIWALGCILYELLCGRSPFDGPDILTIFTSVADGRYEPPERIVANLPAHLGATITACLSVDRQLRAQDCASVLSLLEPRRAPPLPELGVSAGPSSLPAPAARPGAAARLGPATWVAAESPASPLASFADSPVSLWEDNLLLPDPDASSGRNVGDEERAPGRSRARPWWPFAGLAAGLAALLAGVVLVGGLFGIAYRYGWREPETAIPVGAAEGALQPGPVAVEPEPAVLEPGPVAPEVPPPAREREQAPPVTPAPRLPSAKAAPAPAPVVAPKAATIPPPDESPADPAVNVTPTTGTVVVEGGATHVVLLGADGKRRKPSASVPPGTYGVEATFPGGVVITRTRLVTVLAGETTVVRCSAEVESCN